MSCASAFERCVSHTMKANNSCHVDDVWVVLQRRPSTRVQYVQGLHKTEAYYPNTTTKLLTGPAWQLLLSRIGDSLMLYLLMHATMFASLPNGCYLQLSGMPASQVSLLMVHLNMLLTLPDALLHAVLTLMAHWSVGLDQQQQVGL